MSLGYVPREDGDAMMPETYAQALAAFVGRCRPDWDHPGILAAIRKAGDLGPPAAIGAALCRLAENLDMRTPAALEQPGRHWAGTTTATRIPATMCPDHPTEKAWDCQACLSRIITNPAAIAAHAETTRQAIRDARAALANRRPRP